LRSGRTTSSTEPISECITKGQRKSGDWASQACGIRVCMKAALHGWRRSSKPSLHRFPPTTPPAGRANLPARRVVEVAELGSVPPGRGRRRHRGLLGIRMPTFKGGGLARSDLARRMMHLITMGGRPVEGNRPTGPDDTRPRPRVAGGNPAGAHNSPLLAEILHERFCWVGRRRPSKVSALARTYGERPCAPGSREGQPEMRCPTGARSWQA